MAFFVSLDCTDVVPLASGMRIRSLRHTQSCRYRLVAPQHAYMTLNFTNFSPLDGAGCLPNISIVQVSDVTLRESLMGTICFDAQLSTRRRERYFVSNTSNVTIQYYWQDYQASEFTLNVKFIADGKCA